MVSVSDSLIVNTKVIKNVYTPTTAVLHNEYQLFTNQGQNKHLN